MSRLRGHRIDCEGYIVSHLSCEDRIDLITHTVDNGHSSIMVVGFDTILPGRYFIRLVMLSIFSKLPEYFKSMISNISIWGTSYVFYLDMGRHIESNTRYAETLTLAWKNLLFSQLGQITIGSRHFYCYAFHYNPFLRV